MFFDFGINYLLSFLDIQLHCLLTCNLHEVNEVKPLSKLHNIHKIFAYLDFLVWWERNQLSYTRIDLYINNGII